jgi:hypothetical protein
MIGNQSEYYRPTNLNEIAPPIAALYNARMRRTERAIGNISDIDPHSGPVGMAMDYFTPPLGWFISPFTIETIGAHIGTAERCVRTSTRDQLLEDSFLYRAQVAGGQLGKIIPRPRYTFLSDLKDTLDGNHCRACAVIQLAQGKQLASLREVSCLSGVGGTPASKFERATPPPPPTSLPK